MDAERGAGSRRWPRAPRPPLRDLRLLDRALTHTSRAYEAASEAVRDNEALEFLGDAVLGFLVSDLLHRHDPEGDEGTKSRARAELISEASLGPRAAALGLPALLLLGRGEEKTGGREKAALWADAFEAVIAALYLDGGLPAASASRGGPVRPEIAAGAVRGGPDPKSALQELLQGAGRALAGVPGRWPKRAPGIAAVSRDVSDRGPGRGRGRRPLEEGGATGRGREGPQDPGAVAGYSIQPPPRQTSPS